jgi:hypothetical protein
MVDEKNQGWTAMNCPRIVRLDELSLRKTYVACVQGREYDISLLGAVLEEWQGCSTATKGIWEDIFWGPRST